MALFYLVLSTGMSVCIFNYGTHSIARLITHITDITLQKNEGPTSDKKSRPCGSRLGLHLVKQNSKPDTKGDLPDIPILQLRDRASFRPLAAQLQHGRLQWYRSFAPPSNPTPIFIQVQSFRI